MARPPKHPDLHVINGNPGKRKIAPVARTKTDGQLPECPDWLNQDGRAEWKRIVESLPSTVWSSLDWSEVVASCALWQQIVTALRENDPPIASMVQQWRGLRGQFGGNPAARVKLGEVGGGDKSDVAKQFFG